MEWAELKEQLDFVGDFAVEMFRAQIRASGKVNTGAMEQSVRFEIVPTPNSLAIEFYAVKYLKNVSKGRKAEYPEGGNGDFLRALIEWVLQKGKETEPKAAQRAAWAIREHIFQNGQAPTNIIPLAIEEIERYVDERVRQALREDIDKYMKAKLKSYQE